MEQATDDGEESKISEESHCLKSLASEYKAKSNLVRRLVVPRA